MASKIFQQQVYLADIDLLALKRFGIEGIIVDLDNTIVSEDDRYLSPNAEAWLLRAKQEQFGLFLLSNGKREYRVNYWSKRLGIEAIGRARKPFPKNFAIARERMKVAQSERVVVVGDGFHTDVVGAWLSGFQSIQVASLPHKPRWWEQLIGRWVQVPFPKDAPLDSFNPTVYDRGSLSPVDRVS